LLLLAAVLAAGCGDARSGAEGALDDTPAAIAFDESSAGAIRGRVTWTGDVPTVPPFEGWSNPLIENGAREPQIQPNVNAPAVDVASRGVGQAVIFLRGVDPKRSKEWNQPPVHIEQRDHRLHVLQGEVDSAVGFVRRGDELAMVSREPVFHALHAEGAAYFTLTFPDPRQALVRRLERAGLVELTSAAGYFWMRAYLFVDEHPYYARTDGQGRFVLDRVPPGRYEVACWLPSWKEERHEREPESGLIIRLRFQPPVEMVQPVVVTAGKTPEVSFAIGAETFRR
jgi:hypothetical protein